MFGVVPAFRIRPTETGVVGSGDQLGNDCPRQVRVRSTGFSSTVWLRAIEEGPTCSFVLEPSTAPSVV